jgi:DNA-binding IclR family transcriptional regulator
VSGLGLREQALPFLKSLMQRSRLTVHMAIIEEDEAVLIEKIEPPGLVGIGTWVGKRMDLHASSVGKCLLAHLPEEEFLRLVGNRCLARHNENTITSIRKLKLQMEETRRVGYAFEDEEDDVGFRCIGAPIIDASGNCVAAISVAGTTTQIGDEHLANLSQLVRQIALKISEALGFVPFEVRPGPVSHGADYQRQEWRSHLLNGFSGQHSKPNDKALGSS